MEPAANARVQEIQAVTVCRAAPEIRDQCKDHNANITDKFRTLGGNKLPCPLGRFVHLWFPAKPTTINPSRSGFPVSGAPCICTHVGLHAHPRKQSQPKDRGRGEIVFPAATMRNARKLSMNLLAFDKSNYLDG